MVSVNNLESLQVKGKAHIPRTHIPPSLHSSRSIPSVITYTRLSFLRLLMLLRCCVAPVSLLFAGRICLHDTTWFYLLFFLLFLPSGTSDSLFSLDVLFFFSLSLLLAYEDGCRFCSFYLLFHMCCWFFFFFPSYFSHRPLSRLLRLRSDTTMAWHSDWRGTTSQPTGFSSDSDQSVRAGVGVGIGTWLRK